MSEMLYSHPALGLLAVSVPMRIAELRTLAEGDRQGLAAEAGQYIAEHGDELMFRSKKGRSALAFNQLTIGLAALAFSPGGVDFAGLHFEA